MLRYVSTAIVVMAVSTAAWGQVQVIESQPIGGKSAPRTRAPTPADKDAQTELYYRLQQLQQEVQELRGLVEQQSFELRQLKQQRTDDYTDLDRRLSQLSGAAATGPVPSGSFPSSATLPTGSADAPIAPPSDAAQADELAVYRSAIDRVLKQKDYDGGAVALQKYLGEFPSGHYAANALYWLGQIYLQKNELEQSQRWFKQMIEQYPTHQKTPEAKFKLAKTYHSQGETAQAKRLLQEVAESNSPAAGLAKEFLQQNF